MSKKPNPAAIGIFVVGAVVLLVVGVVVFGSGRLFQKTETYVCFFDESVSGLEVGSDVTFKGVPIGRVSSIRIRLENQDPESDAIPVLIEIDENLLSTYGVEDNLSDDETYFAQIEMGLRAQLQVRSYLTGMLAIELDYYPNDPLERPVQQEFQYKEIPTVSSNLNELFDSVGEALTEISKINFVGIATRLESILAKVDTELDELDVGAVNQSMAQVGTSVDEFLNEPELRQAIERLNSTLEKVDSVAGKVDAELGPLAGELRASAKTFRQTMEEARGTLRALGTMVEPGSPLRAEIDYALEEISAAARAVRLLTEYLERNPNALITGRARPEDEE